MTRCVFGVKMLGAAAPRSERGNASQDNQKIVTEGMKMGPQCAASALLMDLQAVREVRVCPHSSARSLGEKTQSVRDC